MTRAIRIHRTGGPEVLHWDSIAVGDPGPGEARVRHTAIGVDFIDIYHRTGLYPLPAYPAIIGTEGAGIVEAVGKGVKNLRVGQRVAYAARPPGAYCEARLITADRLVLLPKDIDDRVAATVMVKGMTAEYLLRRTYKVKKGDTILVHAAAGGVGLIMCQWARALGAKVIGTVGSDEKARIAKAHGCHHPIVYTRENFAERVRALTKGEGVPVVYDSVGKDTLEGSLDCLCRRGLLVSFGNASGAPPPIEAHHLGAKGSLFLTRPSLFDYTATRTELAASARALFAMIRSRKVKIRIGGTYALRDAAQAHAALESRKTVGALVLVP